MPREPVNVVINAKLFVQSTLLKYFYLLPDGLLASLAAVSHIHGPGCEEII